MNRPTVEQIAAFLRADRDWWIAEMWESEDDEALADCSMRALDRIYGYCLAHELFEPDTEPQRDPKGAEA